MGEQFLKERKKNKIILYLHPINDNRNNNDINSNIKTIYVRLPNNQYPICRLALTSERALSREFDNKRKIVSTTYGSRARFDVRGFGYY